MPFRSSFKFVHSFICNSKMKNNSPFPSKHVNSIHRLEKRQINKTPTEKPVQSKIKNGPFSETLQHNKIAAFLPFNFH